MATRITANMNFDPGTDAAFRATALEFSNALQAVGMVKTADTGQTNWATSTTARSATSSSVGYEVFRFDDALQASKPVFFRIDYFNGYNQHQSPNSFGFGITVGSGTNGAGGITGVTAPRQDFWAPWNGADNAWQGTSYFSGDGSGFVAVIGDFGNSPWLVMNFERTRNPADGTAVGEGVLFYIFQGNGYGSINKHNWLMYPTNGRTNAGNWYRDGSVPCTTIVPHGISTGIVGTDVYMWPQFASYPSLYPHRHIYTYAEQDVIRGTEFPMTALGVQRTFKAFSFSSISSSQLVPGIVGATPRSAYAIRWE